MGDNLLRAAVRAAVTEDTPQAQASLLAERVRAGELSLERVKAAAQAAAAEAEEEEAAEAAAASWATSAAVRAAAQAAAAAASWAAAWSAAAAAADSDAERAWQLERLCAYLLGEVVHESR